MRFQWWLPVLHAAAAPSCCRSPLPACRLQGQGKISVKSALGLARAMAAHPTAAMAILENLSVSAKP